MRFFLFSLIIASVLSACGTQKKTTAASIHRQDGFIPYEAQNTHIGMSLAEFRESQPDFATIASSKVESRVWIRYTLEKEKDLSSIAYYFTPKANILFQMVITFSNERDLTAYTQKEFGPADFGGDRWLLKKEDTGLNWDINLWAHKDKLTIRRMEVGSVNPQK